ncbi:MAG: bacillithiol biosynthesis cysteine-adding enzyme BshC [Bacteroidota bacterium]
MDTDCTYISYDQTNSFSELVYDYINNNKKIAPFYQFEPNAQGINLAIEQRKNYATNREALTKILNKQYAQLPAIASVNDNIKSLLSKNTFTICTAHQPNLATGYLYFFYKILHAIKMSEELNQQYPEQHFVPVYYIGSEDNDLDELGQFWYENKKYKWDADGQTGAVGRMDTKSLKPLFEELFKKLGPPGANCEELINLLDESYVQHKTIGAATQYLVHQLFGRYGLIIINPDDAELKSLFKDIISDELFHQHSFPIVSNQSKLLAELYKAQAFPREINLFYLKDNLRERIEKLGENWIVINTNLIFSEEELKEELDKHPERFSPNVILRGLFQETILPNICFIGGGAEVAYWLQLKPLFDYYKVFYPAIFLRQSVQIINEQAWQIINRLQCSVAETFLPENNLTKLLLARKNKSSWHLDSERQSIETIFSTIAEKAMKTDATLEKSAFAALAKMEKQLLIIEQKIYRAEKRKEKETVDQITRLKVAIQPNGGLQERVENFIPYYLQYGFKIFDRIKNNILPFDNQFLIIHPSK